MITWAQIITIMIGILICAGTVVCCDVTIIGEIKKLQRVIQDLTDTMERRK